MEVLDAHYDHVSEMEQQTSSAASQVNEALLNLLQSRPDHAGPMLSAATRATLGKRGMAQLEAVKGALEAAAGSAALARKKAGQLRDEVRTALQTRDTALSTAEEVKAERAAAIAENEAMVASKVLSLGEATRRAEQDLLESRRRAEAAEARVEAVERSAREAEAERQRMVDAVREAEEKVSGTEANSSVLQGRLRREREVLAKLMSENVVFVKRLQLAEASSSHTSLPLWLLPMLRRASFSLSTLPPLLKMRTFL